MRHKLVLAAFSFSILLRSAEPTEFKFTGQGYEITLQATTAVMQDGPAHKTELREPLGSLGPTEDGYSKGYEMQVFVFLYKSDPAQTLDQFSKKIWQEMGSPKADPGIEINEGLLIHIEQTMPNRPLNVSDIYTRRIDNKLMLFIATVARMPVNSKSLPSAVAESKAIVESVRVKRSGASIH